MRIKRHPILEFNRGELVKICFNGQEIEAYSGETIAAALIANDIKTFSHTHKHGAAMGLFCGIGNCSSCSMKVDGVDNIRICITKCVDGMRVESMGGVEAQS